LFVLAPQVICGLFGILSSFWVAIAAESLGGKLEHHSQEAEFSTMQNELLLVRSGISFRLSLLASTPTRSYIAEWHFLLYLLAVYLPGLAWQNLV
jgi:hypothetical protein